jgi:cystathionine beta-lyase
MPDGLLPMWVADMDFRAAPEITDALKKTAEHGIYGYSEPAGDYFGILSAWTKKRYGFAPKEEWHLPAPGVVFSIALAVRAFTSEGDGVIIQEPVYYPFRQMIAKNNRKAVVSALKQNERGVYEPDFDGFEDKIKTENVKLFILCSPHNPVGRVWTRGELARIHEVCKRRNVTVLADEIHADFVYAGHKHTTFAAVAGGEFNGALCLSPSKTFNLAGLQYADVFIPDAALRKRFAAEYERSGYSQLGAFGLAGARAAYLRGEPWLNALLAYLEGNVRLIDSFVKQRLPRVKFTPCEGTYLAWLDFRGYGLAQKELDRIVIEKARLWLDGGTIFGASGAGFERVNFACPRSLLLKALEQLAGAFRS